MLVEGGIVQGWKATLDELAMIYPEHINTDLNGLFTMDIVVGGCPQ